MSMTLDEKIDLALNLIMRLAENAKLLDPWEKWKVRENISDKDVEKIYDALTELANSYSNGQKVYWHQVENVIRGCGYSISQSKAMFGILYGTYSCEEFYEDVEDQPSEVKLYLSEIRKHQGR